MSTTCAGAFRRRTVAWSPRSWRTARAPRFFRRADSLQVRSAPALEKPGSSTARMIAQQAMTLPYPSPSRVDYRVYLSRVKRVGPGVTTEERRSYRACERYSAGSRGWATARAGPCGARDFRRPPRVRGRAGRGPPRCRSRPATRQPSHQARDRVLPERPAAQQRRQRTLEPPRVTPAQVDAEDRLVDPRRPSLVPRHRRAGPLGRAAVLRRQPGAGHRDRRRPETRGERPRPRPVSIAGPRLAHPRRPGRPQCRLQLLLHDALDGVANSLAHHALDGVRTDLAPFSRSPLPAIASHGVILRHPLPSGHSCRPTAPDDDAFFSLFNHTPDITACTN